MSSGAFDNSTLSTVSSDPLGNDSGHLYDSCELPVKTHCDTLTTIKESILIVAITLNIITLLMMFFLRKYEFFTQRILVHMVLSNTLDNIATMWTDGRTDKDGNVPPLCIAQGFFTQIFGMVMFFWVFALTIYLYQKLVRNKETSSYERWYVGVCWIIPIGIAVLPLTTSNYGLVGAPYCWINDTEPMGQIWRFSAYWVPVFAGVFIVFITFVYMHWKASVDVKRFHGSNEPQATRFRKMVRDNLKPLTVYAGSYIVLILPQFANRIQQWVSHTPIYGMMIAHIVGMTTYGIVLLVIFIVTNGRSEFTIEKFRRGIVEHRHHICTRGRSCAGCCGRNDDDEIAQEPIPQTLELDWI